MKFYKRSPQSYGYCGERLAYCRKQYRAETGLNMGHLEGARKNVTLTTLERLCEYYNITLDEFFKDIDI